MFCCCFVCAFIIGQYHSGNNMSSKSGARGEKKKKKKKAPRNSTPENGHAHSEYFQCFHSCTWRIKTLPQSLICTEEISLYTVHIKSVITKVVFLELEAPKYSLFECYVCWNVSWPASTDNVVKNWLSPSLKLYSSHCGMSLHQAPMFHFTAKCLGSCFLLLLLPFFIKLLQ